ncbi:MULTISPECIES: hypothetical protein [Xanthomonas]|uniref:MFS transporter n=3 Tax=Xanthomonas TaxID=338 RepID=A0AB73H2T3_9XANT|nr:MULTISPECIES: hypothetical protein [Xanthomonas]MCC8729418.1 hypothetical protein [Xanthomonas euvesicatoria pv. euvesicatoria]CAJ19821.1 putative membrane protein [Xanthomonas euvesicatoria pv. vesicatoria str. 85-10]MBB5672221.1 hypothetical protein [Xanthomonas arboricola]MCD0261549.1 hypothetical protein [Xanthomonas campestris pv. campestris]MCD0270221.1 hypothetical protein [Xanthomonas campestris pv. campestris]
MNPRRKATINWGIFTMKVLAIFALGVGAISVRSTTDTVGMLLDQTGAQVQFMQKLVETNDPALAETAFKYGREVIGSFDATALTQQVLAVYALAAITGVFAIFILLGLPSIDRAGHGKSRWSLRKTSVPNDMKSTPSDGNSND